ncbi:MAG: response regulator [Treponema sp.]|jgi:signal transduction histidine kinase/DNA-binding response OmpR family regulator|nr:response regulator [Treponema sp.]
MRSISKESHVSSSTYIQLFSVTAAFAIMGILTFISFSKIERGHLNKDVEKTFVLAETAISSSFAENDNGNPSDVIDIESELDRILKDAINTNFTRNSYGILLNNNLEVIAHPQQKLIGRKLQGISSGIASLVPELETGKNIYGRKLKNYMQDNYVVFFQKIKHDLYMGIVIPANEYNKNIRNMAMFLIVAGLILAAVLFTILYHIAQTKNKSYLRTHQKSNFLATMSHEIRTPLNAILGMTEIQMQNTTHPASTSEAFIKINNSGNLLLNIINDILDLSKIEAGKLELTPVKYEVASLINDVVQLNYIRYDSKPIEFIIEVDENIPSILVGDELRIKQILNHLLSNAFKYTDRGQVTLSANAECVGKGGIVLVTLIFQIKDTGQGMTPEQVSKLFDESTRFDLEANRTTEGTGLGMTITRNLINLMYGKILVKSVVGEGTTVTVRLPQKTDGFGISGIIGKEMAESLGQFKLSNSIQFKKSQVTHEYMPYGRILIVDDVETNLYVAKGLMAPYGLNIDLATSGFEAVDKIKEGNVYDIVFMDHMMPKMDGIETTKLLREMGYSHPVVALTANALAGHAELFLKSGFDGFVSKPIDIRQLNVTLNRFIRDKQSVEVLEAAQKKKAELVKKQEKNLGNQQVDSQLAEIFTRDAEKAAATLETLLQNNLKTESDIKLYIINIHAMKSALANIGKMELSAVALKLEQAGREKEIDVILSETQGFISELHNVINEIRPKDEENQISEDTKESLIFLREKLTIIKEACIEFDKKSVKNALNELREKKWSHDTKELLNKIAECILHSEFDSAAALADEYVKQSAID